MLGKECCPDAGNMRSMLGDDGVLECMANRWAEQHEGGGQMELNVSMQQ
jgi:hypothetical protein